MATLLSLAKSWLLNNSQDFRYKPIVLKSGTKIIMLGFEGLLTGIRFFISHNGQAGVVYYEGVNADQQELLVDLDFYVHKNEQGLYVNALYPNGKQSAVIYHMFSAYTMEPLLMWINNIDKNYRLCVYGFVGDSIYGADVYKNEEEIKEVHFYRKILPMTL